MRKNSDFVLSKIVFSSVCRFVWMYSVSHLTSLLMHLQSILAGECRVKLLDLLACPN